MSNTHLRSLPEIIADRANTNENRALECLRNLWELSADDLALPDYRAAAQTFALLAIVDRLGYSGSGIGLVEAVERIPRV